MQAVKKKKSLCVMLLAMFIKWCLWFCLDKISVIVGSQNYEARSNLTLVQFKACTLH